MCRGVEGGDLRGHTRAPMFTGAFTAETWKQLECPPPDERIIKCSECIHRMEHCSAIKGNEALTQVTKWMDLEDTVLSELARQEGPGIK